MQHNSGVFAFKNGFPGFFFFCIWQNEAKPALFTECIETTSADQSA